MLLGAAGTSGHAALPSVDAPATEQAWRAFARNADQTQPAYRFPHAHCFRRSATLYDLPETLLLAVARGESDFEPTARSHAGAHGVMQILWPGTARHLGIFRLSKLYDPCTNIDAGSRYLRELVDRYDGNLHRALAAYNYGPQRIAADGDTLPAGAVWYSAYILRHLEHVSTRKAVPDRQLYSELGQTTLLTFAEPYRAIAFVDRLERHAPGAMLDWFRRATGEFEVVLTYADRAEFDRSAAALGRAGFALP